MRAVSNRLRVHTADRSDAALSADVQSALALDATSESYELTVGVEEGVVRLTGIVDSWAERAHAERVAMSVNGVRAVENELSIRNVGVDYDRKRSDRELARDVQSRLRWDTLVDDALIVVTVEDKEVALRGQVGSARERDRAISDAWVIGAEDVDAGELEIDPNLARSTLRGSKYVAKTDDEIYAAIVDAALYDPRLASYRVEPKVADGDVVLTGKVVNQRAKQAAEQLARATVGVQGVDNQIEVAPHDPVSDEEIARRIREVLRLNSRTDGYEIDVRVRGGVVTVRGEVDSFAEKAEVEDVAASVAGVVELKNEVDVVIETYPFVYDPFLFHYHPYVASTDVFIPTTSQFQDAQIARALQRELYWDPFLVSHEIDIRVVGGEARLSGTVDSYIERRNAEGLAYRVGATSVDNDLVVDPTEH